MIRNNDKPPWHDDLVGSGSGELGSSEANPTVGGIEHGVEALEECVTIDEIKTRPRNATSALISVNKMEKYDIPAVRAKISNDEVDIVTSATNLTVKRTGPNLGVSSERICVGTDFEVEVRQRAVLAWRDCQETWVWIETSVNCKI